MQNYQIFRKQVYFGGIFREWFCETTVKSLFLRYRRPALVDNPNAGENQYHRYTLLPGEVVQPNDDADDEEDVDLVRKGEILAFEDTPYLERAEKIMQSKNVIVNIDMGLGDGQATAWGCDLTYDYVKIKTNIFLL